MNSGPIWLKMIFYVHVKIRTSTVKTVNVPFAFSFKKMISHLYNFVCLQYKILQDSQSDLEPQKNRTKPKVI